MVNISVAYPGASPEEVEQGIVLAIEEAVGDDAVIDARQHMAVHVDPAGGDGRVLWFEC